MAGRRNATSMRGADSRLLAGGFGLSTAIIRLVPHLPNFTPAGALGLYAGARMRWWAALALPLIVMGASDLVLDQFFGLPGFHPFVYVGIVLNVVLGRLLLRHVTSPLSIAAVSVLASIQFFLISNLGVWLSWSMFPNTPLGLVQCYVAAIPFFQYTLLGDLIFCGVLFGVHALVARRASRPVAEIGIRTNTASA